MKRAAFFFVIILLFGSLWYMYQSNEKEVVTKETIGHEQHAIIPDKLNGQNDIEKVQKAVNKAISENRAVHFDRLYDITGGSITIDKANTERKTLYLIGAGGGLKKTDAGYLFTSTHEDTSDIYSTGMKYESENGAGLKVWNGNKLIRIFSDGDTYTGVDMVMEANEKYAQSIKIINATITGGVGWAFEWNKSFDTLIANSTIEHREHGIKNVSSDTDFDNFNLRIVNNVIEGLSGKTLELSSNMGTLIQGNYIEQNAGGYFDFSIGNAQQNGLSIKSNTFYLTKKEISDGVPAIVLGEIGPNGVDSSGNVSQGVLYKLIGSNQQGLLVSSGDVSTINKKAIGNISLFSETSKVTKTENSNGYGKVHSYKFESKPVHFTKGEIKDIVIPVTGVTLTQKDVISVMIQSATQSWSIHIHNWRIEGGNVIARVENYAETEQEISVRANIMQIK